MPPVSRFDLSVEAERRIDEPGRAEIEICIGGYVCHERRGFPDV